MGKSEEEEKFQPFYKMKGIPVHAFLIETGEFNWIPVQQTCSNSEKAKEILEVLKKMPEDRRAVWATRLDIKQTREICPIIKNEENLSKEFDEFCSTYNKLKTKTSHTREVK